MEHSSFSSKRRNSPKSAPKARRGASAKGISVAMTEQLEERRLLATYYIAPTGNDANNGTSQSSPWRSINKVNTVSFQAGDSILFQGGQTFTGTVRLSSDDRSSRSAPIKIGSYGNGRANIYNASGKGMHIRIGGVEISNINIKGGGVTRTNHQGIHFQNPNSGKQDYVRINNVDVSGWGVYGISIQGLRAGGGYNDVRITNTRAFDNGIAGIRFDAVGKDHTNVYVGYNKAHDNPGISDWSRPSGSGIQVAGVTGAVIEYNEAYNNGTRGNFGTGIWSNRSDRVTMQYNSSYNNRAPGGKDGGGFDLDGGTTNSVMQYNYSANNDGNGLAVLSYGGAPETRNVIVRYNISQDDGRRSNQANIAIGANSNKMRDIYIYNNVAYKTDSPQNSTDVMMWTHHNVPNLQVKNNIFYAVGPNVQFARFRDNSGWDIKGNVWYNTANTFRMSYKGVIYTNFNSFVNATGQERVNGQIVGSTSNPLFNNVGRAPVVLKPDQLSQLRSFYSLMPGSSAINRGVSVSFLSAAVSGATRDFFGTSVVNTSTNRLEAGVAEFR